MRRRLEEAEVTPSTSERMWLSAVSRTASLAEQRHSMRTENTKGNWMASGRLPSTTPLATDSGYV